MNVSDPKGGSQPHLSKEELVAAIQRMHRLAHDLNNALMIVSSYSELLREELPPELPCYRYVDEVLRGAGRCQAIANDMLALGRKATGNAPPPEHGIG